LRLTKKMTALLAGGLMIMSLSTVSAVAAPEDHKTTICHKTGQPNKFVKITVDDHALGAHANHQNGGDIIPAPANGLCPGDVAEPPDPPDTKDVVICHRTSPDEPFTKITVQEGPELDAHLAHGDELPDPDDQSCPPVEVPEEDDDGCSNRNSGLSLLQSCNLVLGLNLLNLGQSDQSAVIGDDGSGASNENTGTSLIQLANTSILLNALNLGQSTQSAVTP